MKCTKTAYGVKGGHFDFDEMSNEGSRRIGCYDKRAKNDDEEKRYQKKQLQTFLKELQGVKLIWCK